MSGCCQLICPEAPPLVQPYPMPPHQPYYPTYAEDPFYYNKGTKASSGGGDASPEKGYQKRSKTGNHPADKRSSWYSHYRKLMMPGSKTLAMKTSASIATETQTSSNEESRRLNSKASYVDANAGGYGPQGCYSDCSACPAGHPPPPYFYGTSSKLSTVR